MNSSSSDGGLPWRAETLSSGRFRYVVEIPADKREEAENAALRTLAKSLSLKGFRPGTVPPEIAREHVGKDKILEQVIHEIAPGIICRIIETDTRAPIIPPALSLESVEPLAIGFLFVEEPEATVKKIDAASLKKSDTKVDDKDVERVVQQFLKDMREEAPAERPAQDGDVVIADFWGEDEAGQEIPDTRSSGYRIEIGSNTLIPGFEAGVIGIKKGETKDISLTFPEKYQAEHLRGKPATFHVTATDIRTVKKAELTQELLREKLGAEKTPEEFREEIRKSLIEQEQRMNEQDRQQEFLELLRKATTVELAPELIDAEVRELVREFEQRLSHQQLSIEDWLQSSGKSAEDLQKEMKEAAVRRLTTQFGMRALIKKENIEVSEEEMAEARASALRSVEAHERAGLEEQFKPDTPQSQQMRWNLSVKKLLAKYVS